MLVLYDEEYSPYCGKVRKLMDYKGMRFRTIPVPYHDKVRLLRDTRQDYVPFLRDGRRGVPWTQIVDYLDRKVPDPPAYPPGTRAMCKILEAWEYDWFEDRFWGVVAPFLAPTFRDPVERWNFEEMWERVYGDFAALRRDPASAWASVDPSLQRLEAALEERRFLVASAPSAFDFAISGNFHAADVAGVRIPPKFPRLRRWHRKMQAL